MADFFDSIDKSRLAEAITLVRQCVGEKEAERLEQSLGEGGNSLKLPPNFGASELALVKSVVENPELLRRLLLSPQGKNLIRQITGSR